MTNSAIQPELASQTNKKALKSAIFGAFIYAIEALLTSLP
jgi:hypothetical protein